jgi:hypothetical protein
MSEKSDDMLMRNIGENESQILQPNGALIL